MGHPSTPSQTLVLPSFLPQKKGLFSHQPVVGWFPPNPIVFPHTPYPLPSLIVSSNTPQYVYLYSFIILFFAQLHGMAGAALCFTWQVLVWAGRRRIAAPLQPACRAATTHAPTTPGLLSPPYKYFYRTFLRAVRWCATCLCLRCHFCLGRVRLAFLRATARTHHALAILPTYSTIRQHATTVVATSPTPTPPAFIRTPPCHSHSLAAHHPLPAFLPNTLRGFSCPGH